MELTLPQQPKILSWADAVSSSESEYDSEYESDVNEQLDNENITFTEEESSQALKEISQRDNLEKFDYVCKHWKKGHCNLGDACKFQHPKICYNVPKNKNLIVCKHWAKNHYCKYGDNCNFSHPVEKSKFTETIIIPIESKIVSEKISFLDAVKGDEISDIDVVSESDISNSKDESDDESDDITIEEEEVEVTSDLEDDNQWELVTKKKKQVVEEKEEVVEETDFKPIKTKVCKHWLNGHCKRGNECNFLHGKKEEKEMPIKTKVCKHWLNGHCLRGDECNFLHEACGEITKKPLSKLSHYMPKPQEVKCNENDCKLSADKCQKEYGVCKPVTSSSENKGGFKKNYSYKIQIPCRYGDKCKLGVSCKFLH